MSANRKHVVRFDLWLDPVFDERLAREADVDLTVCAVAAPEENSWAALGKAHVYHVSAAKDELPPRWFVNAELLERCPKLLCASSSGAGFDTIDVAACTKAGVAVVNQAGGNAASVAEHTLVLMLDVSRRITRKRPATAARAGLLARRRDGSRDRREGAGTGGDRPHRHTRRRARPRLSA